MKTRAVGFTISAVLAALSFGQTPAGQTPQATQDRVFHLTHVTTVQEFQEVANVVRTITEVRDASTDNAQMALTVRGTAEQIGLAEWLVKQLDQPAGVTSNPASLEYKGLSEADTQGHATLDGVARIFYFAHMATVQEFQEAVNAIRTVTETRRMFTYNDGRALVVRGTPAQIAMTAWLVPQLDQADPAKPSSTAGEYNVGADDMMRVFYLANTQTVQDFQEIANATRTTIEIRRMFTVNTPRAVLIRSTSDQMAMAQWLLGELDKPAGGPPSPASGEYRVPGAADDLMRVFYIPSAKSVQDFQQIANAVRTATAIRRVFTNNARHAVAVRGTVNQLALAETLIHDLSR
jgi:hypothetical protein